MTATKNPDEPDKHVVYLDVDDDITTVIDKVEGAKSKDVTLVLPKRFATLQSIVNMRLLARTARSASKKPVLITSDSALLPLAGAAGIEVAKNLQSEPEIPPSPIDLPPPKPAVSEDPDAEVDSRDTKLDYHRSIGELAAAGATEESEAIRLEDAEAKPSKAHKTPRDKRFKVPNFDRFRLLLGVGIAGLVLFLIFIIFALFIWPKATITLQTEATPLAANFDLKASDSTKSLDPEKGLIPALLKSSDLTSTQQVQATGQQNNGQKATGSVSFSAQACAPSIGTPSPVAAGTGISTNGLNYITQSAATFSYDSASGSCVNYKTGSVSITAQSGGSKYNVSNASFSVSSRPGVSGTGSASGGTDNLVTILSQQDVDGAKNKISDQDKSKFSDNFKKQLSDQGLYIIDATFKAADPAINASPAVGQPASTSTVTIKITYSVLVIQKSDLKKAVTDDLNKQIDKSRQKIGSDDVLKNLTISVHDQSSPTTASLSISANTTAVPIVDSAAVKKLAAGQKAGVIKASLSDYPGIKNVEVKLSPFWVSKAPKKTSKIHIILQQVKNNQP